MAFEIYEWSEIESDFFRGTLLIGNGASMAVDSRFGYGSLIGHAKSHGLMNSDVNKLFNFFRTNDFELILRLVWQANNINNALNIADDKTREAYIHVRDCLIQTVRDIHPEYQAVSIKIPQIYSFIKKFRTVLSLNYDLILYWAVMYGLEQHDRHEVKDCFIHGTFDEEWPRFRKSLRNGYPTLVFYPHGSLVLCRDRIEAEHKISTGFDNPNLLDSILGEWESGQYVPLFVSEGTTQQKVNAIKASNYLNTIYREVFSDLGTNLVIYGWAFGEHDMHIVEKIKLSEINKIAVSVYGNDQGYCYRIDKIMREGIGREIDIVFFNSNSPGCWCN